MADRIRKNRTQEAEWQTDAFVWRAIRYLDSATDYREYLPGDQHTAPLAQSDFVVLDDSSGFDWRGLRDLALIALLVTIILLLALHN
ncbi:MAG: hypothetical protein LAO76_24715 [Acidobacteriia bacterium]|nr:hypothetical protein [Terriglobia bacterium]